MFTFYRFPGGSYKGPARGNSQERVQVPPNGPRLQRHYPGYGAGSGPGSVAGPHNRYDGQICATYFHTYKHETYIVLCKCYEILLILFPILVERAKMSISCDRNINSKLFL